MNLIELDRAISEITQAWEDVGSDPRRSPFFLIVGAGISYPPIPLAASIVEHCEKTAKQYQRGATLTGERALDKYSFWFSLAYPQARQRQKYFRQLIENQPISLANLRLAHLLSARKLTNLVVTTNFDDFLIKALRLFGHTPAVCDHPSTVARIDVDSPDIQIVYAHGSYLFYDLANLQGEITGRAQANRDSSLTMVGLLDNLLWNRSPIVIGYSGWEGDVIMSALKRRVRGGHPLGQSIYWCCYTRDVPSQLPEWLRESGDVQFVVPQEQPAATKQATTRGTEESAGTMPSAMSAETTPVLTAREVLERLGQALDAPDPPLIADPLNFMADQLAATLPKDESVEEGGDPYGFKALIERIRAAARQQAQPQKELVKKLEAVTAGIRRSQYANVIKAASAIVPHRLAELTPEQRKDLLSKLALAGDALLARHKFESALIPQMAQVLVIDIRWEEQFGPVPAGVAILLPARASQMSFETVSKGEVRGAFSLGFEQTLRGAAKHSKRYSLHDAIVDTAHVMLTNKTPQCPVLVGQGRGIVLFAPRQRTSGRAARGKLHALLVGIDQYDMSSANLRGCVNDAKAFRALFEELPALFGPATIKMMLNREATATKIRVELRRLAERSRAEDVLVFAFSGHATSVPAVDRVAESNIRQVLVAHDFKDGKGVVPLTDVVEVFRKAKAKTRIVLVS